MGSTQARVDPDRPRSRARSSYSPSGGSRGEGFSVSVHGEALPPTGYMVSLMGYEQKVPVSSLTVEMMSYVADHQALLSPSHRFFGGWIQSGEVYLDVSDWMADRKQSVQRGLTNHQISIYDIANDGYIYMADEQKKASVTDEARPKRVQIFAPVDLEGGGWDEDAAAALVDHIREVSQIMDLADEDPVE